MLVMCEYENTVVCMGGKPEGEPPRTLPYQLQNPAFRFCKLKGKNPYEPDWLKRDYTYNDVLNWRGKNYGALGGCGDLLIIDADDERAVAAMEQLPQTFTAQGRKGGHFYFICPGFSKSRPLFLLDGEGRPVLDKEKQKPINIGHATWHGRQCVGPGSIHPDTVQPYRVVKDLPIATITPEDMESVLRPFTPECGTYQEEKDTCKEHRFVISAEIASLINLSGFARHGNEYKGKHPKHGSTTGENFCVNAETNMWHCFRCGTGGGPLHLVAVMENIIECHEAVRGALRGEKFKDTLKIAKERYNIELTEKVQPRSLQDAKEAFKKWLYIEDDSVVDVVLATAVANRFKTDPTWLILVEPPSSGKTEILRAFQGALDVMTVSTLTPKSLISGKTNPKNYRKTDDPSLFAHINNKILVIKDLTLVLSLPTEQQNEIFGILRDAYDGYCERKTGETARTLAYKTKFGLLAACTPAIDSSGLVHAYLGERFLKFRMQNDRQKALSKAKINRRHIEDMRSELNEAVKGFLAQDFAHKEIAWPAEVDEKVSILSDVITKLRTPVARDAYKWSFVKTMPEAEYPMRFDNSLRNLGEALAIIRGKEKIEEEELEIIVKIALDCLPRKTLAVFQCLLGSVDDKGNTIEIASSNIGAQCRLNTDSVRYALQDLVMLGIAHENQAKSNRYLYKLDERKAPTGGDELLGGSKGLREKIEPIKGYILKNKLYTDIEETEEGHDEQENARG